MAWKRARTLLVALVSLGLGAAALGDAPAGLLNPGTEWETPYYILEADQPGPTVMLTGGMHGNEPAGYRAAAQIRHWPLARGKLVIVPLVNVPGLREATRYLPALREDKDLRNANRNFPREGEPDVAKTPPCEALWALAREVKPDWAIDLHEGYDFHIANSKSVGSSVIYRGGDELRGLAGTAIEAVNATIPDPKRRIVRLDGGPVNGGFLRAAHDRLGAEAVCFETTYKKQPLSTRTRQQRTMVSTLLREIGLLDRDCSDTMVPERPRDLSYAALFDGDGTFGKGPGQLTRLLDDAGEWAMHHVGPVDVRRGLLGGFDVAIFPGGSGSRQAKALRSAGRLRVQEFVREGGGYMGICAGAYLSSSQYSWSLGLLNTATLCGPVPGVEGKSMWHRGEASCVQVEFTDAARDVLGPDLPASAEVRYANGPILSPGGRQDLPDYTTLAYFRSEVVFYDAQKGTMVDTPAMVAGPYGAGRALAVSPHLEASDQLRPTLIHALDWLVR